MHETDRTPPKELLPAWAGPPAAEAGEQALNANQVPGAYSAMMEDPLETFAAAHKMVCHNAWNDNKNIVQNVSLDGYPFLSKPRNHCMANLNKTSETCLVLHSDKQHFQTVHLKSLRSMLYHG